MTTVFYPSTAFLCQFRQLVNWIVQIKYEKVFITDFFQQFWIWYTTQQDYSISVTEENETQTKHMKT